MIRRTSTGVGEKICCEFWRTLPSSISGTRSRATRLRKARDEKSYPSIFVFSFSPLWVYFAKKSFWRVASLDAKKQICITVFGPVIKKYEKKHEPFSMMVTTLIFTPKWKSLVFSRSAAVRRRGYTNRMIRLSLSFTLMCGLLGLIHTIFSRMEFFLLPLYA